MIVQTISDWELYDKHVFVSSHKENNKEKQHVSA
jgi:hypothetical protein